VNGVARGLAYNEQEGKAVRGRSGMRGNWWPRTLVYGVIGFRLNGVYHGDGANPKDVTYWGRCSARSSAILRNKEHDYIGFRLYCEWC